MIKSLLDYFSTLLEGAIVVGATLVGLAIVYAGSLIAHSVERACSVERKEESLADIFARPLRLARAG
jgi:hypothetical protein